MPISEWGMVRSDGSPTPLNSSPDWLRRYNVLDLPTGYYSGYVQTTNKNSSYGVGVNLPDAVDGFVIELEVIDFGYEGRKTFTIIRVSDGSMYSSSSTNNSLTEWSYHLRANTTNTLQQKRLTYANGEAMSWQNGTDDKKQMGVGNLLVAINKLDTGFYRGSISPIDNDNRNLPTGFPIGQVCTALIWKTQEDRKTILLFALYTNAGWLGTTGVDGENLHWKRLDDKEDLIGQDKAEFSIKMNKRANKHFKLLAITDTHAQEQAGSTQISYVNPSHFQNIDDLDRQIKTNDITIHLGDWIDGNYPKKIAGYSLTKLGTQFFEKPNRYGVIGNHDYNGQWDGNAGNHAKNKGDLNYQFTVDEVKYFLTPNGEPYYFVDHPSKKIRMIYLHSFDIPFWLNPLSDRLFIDPQDQPGFGAEQVEWFISTLKSVPDGFNVIIVTHETFNNVYENKVYYNGNMMKTIAEAYQNKKVANKITTGIGASHPVYDYYKLATCSNGCIDFSDSKGKILAVLSGHRHEDNTNFINGIRYITLLCSRPAGDGSPNKPTRNYFDVTQEAISFLEFNTIDNIILNYRFGAGKELRTYNMFSY